MSYFCPKKSTLSSPFIALVLPGNIPDIFADHGGFLAMRSLVGQTVSHYHITEELGAGGTGVRHKAHDSLFNRTLALMHLPHYWRSFP